MRAEGKGRGSVRARVGGAGPAAPRAGGGPGGPARSPGAASARPAWRACSSCRGARRTEARLEAEALRGPREAAGRAGWAPGFSGQTRPGAPAGSCEEQGSGTEKGQPPQRRLGLPAPDDAPPPSLLPLPSAPRPPASPLVCTGLENSYVATFKKQRRVLKRAAAEGGHTQDWM